MRRLVIAILAGRVAGQNTTLSSERLAGAGGDRLLRVDPGELGQHPGADVLGHRHTVLDVAGSLLRGVGRRLLAIVDQVAVEIDLEAALGGRSERDADLAVAAGDGL